MSEMIVSTFVFFVIVGRFFRTTLLVIRALAENLSFD